MKRIPKATEGKIDDLVATLEDEASAVRAAIEAYNEVLDEHRAKIDAACFDYNNAASELRDIIAELAQEAGDYFDDRSEKWQESAAGEQYAAWKESLESAAAEIPEADEIELQEIDEQELFDSESWPRPEACPEDV